MSNFSDFFRNRSRVKARWQQSLVGAIALAAGLVTLTACGQAQPDATAGNSPEAETASEAPAESTETASGASNSAAVSSEAKQALAQHLNAIDATMYGAYWCPHCVDQKAMFGDAADTINYVECDPEGEDAQPQLCQAEGIEGFPTWKINGELYPGVQPLEQLATLSGYDGSQDFE